MREELKPSQLLDAVTRRAWRAWLRANARSAREIWLVFWKKHTGKPSLLYNDAVEEALCFGWIDSTARRLDEDRYAQRFSPRRPGIPYSPANQERLRHLIEQGQVTKAVLATLELPDKAGFTVAPDILAAIKANATAWKNFQRFPPAYVRIRIGYIEGARKRPEEFGKRLGNFVRMTERDRRIGFGGIEKHYDRA